MSRREIEQALLRGNYLLTVRQVCEILGLSRSKVYALIQQRALPCVRIGRAVRVAASDVRAYLLQLQSSEDDEERREPEEREGADDPGSGSL